MYKFDPSEPVDAGFRAIALSQLNDALAELDRSDGDARELVHASRRRCKKLRGLLRLARAAFKDFAIENAALRHAAALLSHLRDEDVLRQTLNELASHSDAHAERLRSIAENLQDLGDGSARGKLAEFRTALESVRDRAPLWSLTTDEPFALIAGLRRTYRQGRRLMHTSERSRAPARFHEWRKATKNHGFHIDLLKRAAPTVLDNDLRAVDELATCLGIHHDLVVLREEALRNPARFGDRDDIAAVRNSIEQRLPHIERHAFDLGRQIFAERPKAVAQRFRAYWDTAR